MDAHGRYLLDLATELRECIFDFFVSDVLPRCRAHARTLAIVRVCLAPEQTCGTILLSRYQLVCEQGVVHNPHLCAIQEIVQFLRAFSNTNNCAALTFNAQYHDFPIKFN